MFPRSSFVGLDSLLSDMQAITRSSENHYPPHNLKKISETKYKIELAVAGFNQDELSISVEDRTLTISGDSDKSNDESFEYIHRGISTKKFNKKFRLSDYVEVSEADIIDGILIITLDVIVPEEMQPKSIPIGKAQFLTESK
jgi:molecular chaperone IbpA